MENNKTCQSWRHNGSPCGRQLYDDKHCIFHSENIEKKKKKFDIEFLKEFKRQEKEDEVFDFSWFVFPGEMSFVGKIINKGVYFRGARFSGKINFFEAKFFGEADFTEAKFFKEVNLIKAEFSGEARFMNTEFYNKANFMNAQFFKWVLFNSAEFLEVGCFDGVKFFSKAYFSFAEFSNKISFIESEFSDEIVFIKAKFFGDVYLMGSKFLKIAYFQNVKFYSRVFLNSSHFENVYELFEALQYEKKYLWIFKKTKYKFKDFRFFLGDRSAVQYPVINRKANDAWYLEDYKRQHPNIYRLWKISSNCGQKLSWWAGWSLGIALIFAIIYMAMGFGAFEARHYTWFSYFYYSIVTFTTLGFGDITPIKWYSEIAVTVEVILGYIMLGGLISIFATKLARRS